MRTESSTLSSPYATSSGGGLPNTAATDILAAQVEAVYCRLPVALIASLLNAAILASILHTTTTPSQNVAWLTATLTVFALRAWDYRARKLATRTHRPTYWARRFSAAIGLSGAVWGCGALIYYAPGALPSTTLLVFVLGGLCAGATASAAAHFPAFLAYIVPCLAPMVALLLTAGDLIHAGMGLMLLLFGFTMTALARTTNRAFTNSVRLRLENEQLLRSLAAAAADLAQSNDTLERRVQERGIELETTMAQLSQSNQLAGLGRVVTAVAHEINNPLTYVLSSARLAADALQQDALDVPRARELLTEVAEGAERIRVIVGDLEAISPSPRAELGPVDVCAVLHSCIKVMHNDIRHRATLTQSFESVPPVLGNATRLSRVFLDLLINATHAIPDGDASSHGICVSTKRLSSDRVEVTVRDTGVGIAPEDLGRVFEPFFTTKPVGQGSGLGLSVCRGLIAGLGGEISLQSRLGEGTAVTVVLNAAEVLPVATPSVAVPLGAARPARVLIIDDDEGVAKSLQRILQRHHVTVMLNGRDGLATAKRDNFDVIFCDVMMPDVTGMDIYYALRDANRHECVVFVTGGAFSARARAFLQEVNNLCLTKPFDFDEVRNVVAQRVAT